MSKKEVPEKENIEKQLQPLSKAVAKTVGEIWRMFVLRYMARGIGEIFLSVAVVAICHQYFGYNKFMMVGSLIAGAVLIFDAIQLLINPSYFALNDVTIRLKSEQLSWTKK